MSLSISNSSAISTIAYRGAAAPVVAETAEQAIADLNAKRLTQAVVVQDTSSNIQKNWDGLQKIAALGKLGSFQFTDANPKVQFNATQLSTSAGLMTALTSSGVSLAFSDNAANAIKLNTKLTTQMDVSVTDTASRVVANLAGLQTLAATNKLDKLTLSDVNQTLTLTAAQYSASVALRSKLVNAQVTVVDTAARIATTNLSTVSDGAITVKDTAINLAKNFEALATLARNGNKLGSVQLTDKTPALTLTVDQYINSQSLRGKLANVSYTIKDTASAIAANASQLNGLTIAVSDRQSSVQSNIDALQTFANAGKLASLKFTDTTAASLSLTVAQAKTMGVMSGAKLTIQDTAANIQNNLDALQGMTKIAAIQLTDTARPTLTVSDAQYKKDANVLAKISGASISVKFSGNYGDYKIKENTDGSFSVNNSKYKNVNFLSFQDFTTFADSGDPNVNALLLGGSKYWWSNAGGVTGSSNQVITSNLYSLASESTKHAFTYSFMNALPSNDTTDNVSFKPMSADQQAAVRKALDYLSSIINVTFTEDNTAGGNGKADINFGTNNQISMNSSGYANIPNGSGDHPVFLFLDNSYKSNNSDLSQGSYGWQTLIHEIGHTLGLKHPGNYNAGGGGAPAPYLPVQTDSRRYSVMSYNNAPGSAKITATALANGTRYSTSTVNDSTYMLYDMAALQFLYGRGNGLSTYQYQVTTFTADWSGMETLWAPQGSEINAAAVSNSNIIDLRAGAFSSIGILPKSLTDSFPSSLKTAATYVGLNNVALSYGSQIKTATGGSGNDVFYTSTTSDVTINGGGGSDTVFLAGAVADWAVQNGDYVNAKLGRTVKLNGISSIKYYDAANAATTHSLLDLQA